METRKNSILATLSRVNWRAWLPSRGNVLFTLVIVFALFWAQSANALPWQAPSLAATSTGTWPYQGRLADSAGNPITATVPMIFRLYNASTGGVPLWEELWTGPSSVQVSDGLFNVMLGSLTAIPQSLVGGNSSLWLGITAGTDDEMAPRIQLGSVPFAVQALTVPDGSIGTAKIADNSLVTSKFVDGSISTLKIADGAVTQSKLGPDINLIPPDGSITQIKAPSLVKGQVDGVKILYGEITLTASTSTNLITMQLLFGEDFESRPRIILQPYSNFSTGVTATIGGSTCNGHSCGVRVHRVDGSNWAAGEYVIVQWVAIGK